MTDQCIVATCFVLVLHISVNLLVVNGQLPTTQPLATSNDCICKPYDEICRCNLTVKPKLTMIYKGELIYPDNGTLRYFSSNKTLTPEEAAEVLTADGQKSRLVISVNGQFSGPRIEVYENQTIEIVIVNKHHTDSITVHFHGIHQRDTPWMDGVAFVTQCPILSGQTFVHRFKAYPPGTSLYHAHIGDQRSRGLYGPFIVRAVETKYGLPVPAKRQDEIIVTLQDWNHKLDAETAFYRAMSPQFNMRTREKINSTRSLDGAMFSQFVFHSGLVNGKGRFWYNKTANNGAPLEKFIVHYGKTYYFRVISASTLYPMRVYIEGQTLTLKASDVSSLKPIKVQSIILHPGERYDFEWQVPSNSSKKEILLIAQTLETEESLGGNKYHAAEAVIEFAENPRKPTPDPVNDQKENCTEADKCVVFNCPFGNYGSPNRTCLNFNHATNNHSLKSYDRILGNIVNEEYFLNFGFPGTPGHAPGSVNGRQFIFPTTSLLTEPGILITPCDEDNCAKHGTCSCTNSQELGYNKLIQMTFINLGNGSGWSHPIHMHGHFFYVMKMGLGTYDNSTGKLLKNSEDIKCTDSRNCCSSATWSNQSWLGGNVPGLNMEPPAKDTVVLPTGGYVVVRFISDNPGLWFMHCHIDLHTTSGMSIVLNEAFERQPLPPGDFPRCGDFFYNGVTVDAAQQSKGFLALVLILSFLHWFIFV